MTMAEPPITVEREACEPTPSVTSAVLPWRTSLTRLIGSSSASAAICAKMVSMPCPTELDPTWTTTLPSSSIAMRAFSNGPEAPPSI